MATGRIAHPEFTVASLTARIKGSLEAGFSNIIVEGEISEWKRPPSGHCYFTLKDAEAKIHAVMFSSSFEASCARHAGLREGLRDGAKVKVFGSVTVFPPQGRYQIVVRAVTLAGVGELMRQFLELKAKLEREGLFDASRKRPLPFLPRRIGIVTSESGAVIHDMCTVLLRRFPHLEIRLYPSQVQGADAPRTIIAGLQYFNANPPDLVIVARGGGSFEDLFCFNDESLVREVAASKAPVISAVGHETDYTLCDFAADLRAGTPSIAAELAVPVESELRARLAKADDALVRALRGKYEWFAQRTDHLAASLAPALVAKASEFARRLESLGQSLSSSVALGYSRREAAFAQARAKLELLSPYGVLNRGYSLTTDARGAVVRSPGQVAPGETIRTRLAAGELVSTVS